MCRGEGNVSPSLEEHGQEGVQDNCFIQYSTKHRQGEAQ